MQRRMRRRLQVSEAFDDLAAPSDGEALPECVGPYRIVRKVDEGANGVVYEALSTPPLPPPCRSA